MSALRVATYNVRHCLGVDSVLDLERIARVISETGAGLVALQELDRHRPRSGRVDQPARLAELTGMTVRFWPTLRKRGGEYGVGLATKKPVEARFDPLPRLGSEEPRGVIVARWNGLTVLAAHLSIHTEVLRVQTIALAGLARALGGPIVVLGDLNQPRHALGPLIASGLDPGPEPSGPGGDIDHVMTGPGVVATRVWTIPSPASDHVPVVADLELQTPHGSAEGGIGIPS